MDCPKCKKMLPKDNLRNNYTEYFCVACNQHFSVEFINGYWRGYHEGRYDGNEEQLERLRQIL